MRAKPLCTRREWNLAIEIETLRGKEEKSLFRCSQKRDISGFEAGGDNPSAVSLQKKDNPPLFTFPPGSGTRFGRFCMRLDAVKTHQSSHTAAGPALSISRGDDLAKLDGGGERPLLRFGKRGIDKIVAGSRFIPP